MDKLDKLIEIKLQELWPFKPSVAKQIIKQSYDEAYDISVSYVESNKNISDEQFFAMMTKHFIVRLSKNIVKCNKDPKCEEIVKKKIEELKVKPLKKPFGSLEFSEKIEEQKGQLKWKSVANAILWAATLESVAITKRDFESCKKVLLKKKCLALAREKQFRVFVNEVNRTIVQCNRDKNCESYVNDSIQDKERVARDLESYRLHYEDRDIPILSK